MSLWSEIESILPLVEKPARYIGGERGSVIKAHEGRATFALAFPEVYELGASHFGGLIIYNILNSEDDIVCERVYMPWEDMRAKLIERKIPLVTLETKTPLKDFNVVGFSLEHELSYTNVLDMLNLAGIPITSASRSEDDPIVIAGGVSAFNPEPMTPFFDAFYIGDAEVNLVDVVRFIGRNKGKIPRRELIRDLARFDGIYVPALYKPRFIDGRFDGFEVEDEAPYPVKANIAPELKDEFYPKPPIIPWIEVVHNRLRVEINRGCPKGCRFCQAGFVYRPNREREVESIVSELRRNYELTGWAQIGVLSLSATDYSNIIPLIDSLRPWIEHENIEFSLPSIRPEKLSHETFRLIGFMRKTGLTFAPEAGTERLRAVINKPYDIDKLYWACEKAFKLGWRGVKLYFMIGLPTETDEDLFGIVEILRNVSRIAKRFKSNVRVTVSPFVPKPHTPFSWARQIDAAEIKRRGWLIKSRCPGNVNVDLRRAEVSILEGILSRGDRRLGDVIMRAWQKGAINAAWKESFKPELFFEAMSECGLSVDEFLRERDTNEPLPWDIIDKGIKREFLIAEYNRALLGKTLPPCDTRNCEKCDFCDIPPQRIAEPAKIKIDGGEEFIEYGRFPRRKGKEGRIFAPYIRIKYRRCDMMRFLGHLDVVRLWEMSLRRAKVPVSVSEGFHKHLRITYGPPLPLGAESEAEYMDIKLSKPIGEHTIARLSSTLPDGMDVISYKALNAKPAPLQSVVSAALWECKLQLQPERLEEVFSWAEKQAKIPVKRHKKTLDIRRFLLGWRVQPDDGSSKLMLLLMAGDRGSGRPQEYLSAYGISEDIIAVSRFVRKELLIPVEDGYVNPFGERVDVSFFGT